MISAILYKSATGSCERYAREMSRKLAIPSYPVDGCPLPKGMEVVYIGWLMNGAVQGLKKAQKNYQVKAVVQVGMSPASPSAEATCREKNGIGPEIAVFSLQGGFHMKKLSLPMQAIMKVVNPTIVKRLSAKSSLNAAEQATMTMASTGEGEPASWDGIQAVVDWVLQTRNPLDVMKWHEPQ